MTKLAGLVFLGGAIGAILREALMLIVGETASGFPLDIFIANVVASVLLGVAFSVHARKGLSDAAYVLVGTGMMGGLSTFSSFVLAAVQLVEQTPTDAAAATTVTGTVYVLLSVVAGFGAVFLGLLVGRDRSSRSR